MGTPYLGEIKILSFNFPPKGWAECNGQLLPINQNQALFSILGTTYGGDGRVNFGLPNLQGRIPIYIGQGIVEGQAAGEVAHTLSIAEMPGHNHLVNVTNATSNDNLVSGNLFGKSVNITPYGTSPNTPLSQLPAAPTVTNAGGSQAHNNMMPYLTLNMVIALQGVFPSRN